MGFALVAVSVAWWLLSHAPEQKDFIYFKVIKVQKAVEVLRPRSDDVYVRTSLFEGLKMPGGDPTHLEDHYFLIPVTDAEPPDKLIMFNYLHLKRAIEANFYKTPQELRDRVFEIFLQNKTADLREIKRDGP